MFKYLFIIFKSNERRKQTLLNSSLEDGWNGAGEDKSCTCLSIACFVPLTLEHVTILHNYETKLNRKRQSPISKVKQKDLNAYAVGDMTT